MHSDHGRTAIEKASTSTLAQPTAPAPELQAPTLPAPQLQAFDARQFRGALGRFASGVTIVTTRDSVRTHGMTANSFVSVSLDPPLILISVDNRAAMHTLLPVTRYFGVSVLAEDQHTLSNHFAGREVEGIEVPFVDNHDVPVIDGAVEHFETREGKPLVFHAGSYRKLHAD